MYNKQKAQISIELIIILGILVVGAIIVGIFVINSSDQNINSASNTTNQISGTVNNFVDDFEDYQDSMGISLTVNIISPTEAAFALSGEDIYFDVEFENSSGSVNFIWKDGTDIISAEQSFDISPLDFGVGIYDITVEIEDNESTASDIIAITITNDFFVNITFPTNGEDFNLDNSIYFNALAGNNIGSVNYDWDVDDGTYIKTGEKDFTENASVFGVGIHTVEVTAIDISNGTEKTDTIDFTIVDNFTVGIESPINDSSYNESDSIHFKADPSCAPGQASYEWKWNGTPFNTNYNFNEDASEFGVGNHTVELTATHNTTGSIATASVNFEIIGFNPMYLSDVSSISLGGPHTCALLNDGTMKCWGSNNFGQIGNNSTTDVYLPTTILSNVSKISAGGSITCAVLNDKTVKCWGRNDYGQVGIGNNNTPVEIPSSVVGLNNISLINAGGFHACSVRETTNVLKCWGDNGYGQLGDDSGEDQYTPVSVNGLYNVSSISLGYRFSCALVTNGDLYCWGRNSDGQLGNNSTTSSHVPILISGIDDINQISLGHSHTCALLNDKTVKCWGRNDYGQLGLGSISNYTTTPTYIVINLNAEVSSIDASSAHSCAVLNDGTVKCWGLNSDGQLGNNSITNSATPVFVLSEDGGGDSLLININSPINDSTFSLDDTISFDATVNNYSGSTSCEWIIPGVYSKHNDCSSFTEDVITLGEGTHTLTVTITDSLYNQATDEVTFYVETIDSCNYDGICDVGEDEIGCPDDCPEGCNLNGTCDAGNNENLATCPVDCGTSETSCSDLTRRYECEGNLVRLNSGIRSISECKALCETSGVTTCCYYNSFWNNCSYADTLSSSFWPTRYAGSCS